MEQNDKPKIKASYIKEIIDSIEWPEDLKNMDIIEKYKMALIIQQNLQLSRTFELLAIAVGLDADENSEEDIEEAKTKSLVCPTCSKGVVPDRMGYCPNCCTDLRMQFAAMALSQKKG